MKRRAPDWMGDAEFMGLAALGVAFAVAGLVLGAVVWKDVLGELSWLVGIALGIAASAAFIYRLHWRAAELRAIRQSKESAVRAAELRAVPLGPGHPAWPPEPKAGTRPEVDRYQGGGTNGTGHD